MRFRQIRTGATAALALAAAAVLTLGLQSASAPATAQDHPSAGVQSPGAGTATKDRGSTGWHGSSREQNATGVGSRALTGSEAETAADQPEMATGVDLNGPPRRFVPAQTPE
jgi:hypothetical protein